MKRKILIIIVAIAFVISSFCAMYGYLNRNKEIENTNSIENNTKKDNINIADTSNIEKANNESFENNNYNNNDEDNEEDFFGAYVSDCSSNDCTLYKDNNILVEFKNVIEINEDTYSCDIYTNSKLSYSLDNCGEGVELEKIDSGFLIKKISESYYVDFYAFGNDGKLINDFSKEKEKYKNEYIQVFTNNNSIVMTVAKYTTMDDGNYDLIKDSYCDLKPNPKDSFSTIFYYRIKDNILDLYNTETVSWEEAYLCTNDGEEHCGDINKVKCDSSND